MTEFPDNFDLYYREVVLKHSGRVQKIYFFVKEGNTPKSGTLLSDKVIPEGWKLAYGWNGLPFLKRK